MQPLVIGWDRRDAMPCGHCLAGEFVEVPDERHSLAQNSRLRKLSAFSRRRCKVAKSWVKAKIQRMLLGSLFIELVLQSGMQFFMHVFEWISLKDYITNVRQHHLRNLRVRFENIPGENVPADHGMKRARHQLRRRLKDFGDFLTIGRISLSKTVGSRLGETAKSGSCMARTSSGTV